MMSEKGAAEASTLRMGTSKVRTEQFRGFIRMHKHSRARFTVNGADVKGWCATASGVFVVHAPVDLNIK